MTDKGFDLSMQIEDLRDEHPDEGTELMFDAWVLIPLAPFHSWPGSPSGHRHQSKMAEKYGHLPKGINEDTDRMREEMKYLKERVATLEKDCHRRTR